MSNFTLDELMPMVERESSLRRGTLLRIFAIVALLFLLVGFFWKAKYTSGVTLYVDDTNIVKPLLENLAEAGNQRDKANVAREILFSRDILENILENGGWVTADTSPIERERIKEEIIQSTEVTNINSTLIGIRFEHSDARVSYETTSRFADLFLEKAAREQSVESNDAFEFIESQVETYRGKLEDAEKRLETFKSQYPGIRPGTEGNVEERIIELRRQAERTQLLFAEASQRARTLDRELATESYSLQRQFAESRYADRINELQSEIDVLRLSYTDDYPDIVRLKQQIEEFKVFAAEDRERVRGSGGGTTAFQVGTSVYSGSANLSPVYQQLRSEAAQTKAEADSLRSRLNQTNVLLQKELGRAETSGKVQRELAELSRDYRVNKDIYEDLVKRRESARVSMSLGKEKQGVLYRIQEPANFPVLPSGLRFMHLATIGLLLGGMLPFMYLIAFLKLDPRIRTSSAITDDLDLPLLTTVPHMVLPGEKKPWLQTRAAVFWVVLLVLLVYAAVGFYKYNVGAA